MLETVLLKQQYPVSLRYRLEQSFTICRPGVAVEGTAAPAAAVAAFRRMAPGITASNDTRILPPSTS